MKLIVGIGELLWDIYPDGRKVAGGAPFNFAFHCQQLGHPAAIVSRVGDDELGRELLEEVRRLGMSDAFIQIDSAHPTGTVLITIDEHHKETYTIPEHVAWDYIGAEGYIDDEFAHDTQAVCFGSLAQRHPVSCSTIQKFVQHGPHMPSALRIFDVNLRLSYYSDRVLAAGLDVADWLKVNATERKTIPGCEAWLSHDDLEPSQHERLLIVTEGKEGVTLAQRTDMIHEPAAPLDKVGDYIGAGDAFTAAMVCLYLEGKRPLKERARFANYYAARVCEHRGGTPRINRAEVERAAFGSV